MEYLCIWQILGLALFQFDDFTHSNKPNSYLLLFQFLLPFIKYSGSGYFSMFVDDIARLIAVYSEKTGNEIMSNVVTSTSGKIPDFIAVDEAIEQNICSVKQNHFSNGNRATDESIQRVLNNEDLTTAVRNKLLGWLGVGSSGFSSSGTFIIKSLYSLYE